MVYALGNLVRFILLPAQSHGINGVAPLIDDLVFEASLADKAFDANWLRLQLDARGICVVIPPKVSRKQEFDIDREMYKWRHLIENYFAKIEEFRGIATRYDKSDCSYRANWYLAAALIAAR